MDGDALPTDMAATFRRKNPVLKLLLKSHICTISQKPFQTTQGRSAPLPQPPPLPPLSNLDYIDTE